MARPAQESASHVRDIICWLSLVSVIVLAGCGTKGFSIEDAAPDRSIVTGSIASDPEATSDEATVRNAVSAAIVDEIGSEGLGWANVETGARGTIRDLHESRQGQLICRSFNTTRESFAGVHLYSGEACLAPSRQWAMHRFQRVE